MLDHNPKFVHLIFVVRSGLFLCNSFSSWFVLIVQIPIPVIVLYVFLEIFFSHLHNITLTFAVINNIS
jgi:hypothetical protein